MSDRLVHDVAKSQRCLRARRYVVKMAEFEFQRTLKISLNSRRAQAKLTICGCCETPGPIPPAEDGRYPVRELVLRKGSADLDVATNRLFAGSVGSSFYCLLFSFPLPLQIRSSRYRVPSPGIGKHVIDEDRVFLAPLPLR